MGFPYQAEVSPLSSDESNSSRSSVPPTPDSLIGAPAPSPRSDSRLPFSPPVTQQELGDGHSGMKSLEGGLELLPVIPEHMLVEFQTDVGPETSDPPPPPPRSTRSSPTRDGRCKCSGPISDWTRHWRRSCPGNPSRSFACDNGCGKTFTRRDNMKRHVSSECRLNRGFS
ncbi:hypothetical protein M407DRAFT_243911 [Tulasnella calospora MUT 4182]|uniref:C2H2-type domain-containing protein n=1 Tax=Tulasnella calospora MUT 4182 TaxID=1051891 RepID=A0A0C3Q834_9AGAM|nr:hypothetical protein M407DRAFT_243911 [Tulasnella calospora MUT 4182]